MNYRAKDIFLEAIELPSDQQDAYVEKMCAEDDLLRREVLGMLATHRRAGEFLDTPASLDSTWLASQRVMKPQYEQTGDVIDHYKLVRILGEGGFGTVFLAHQIEPVVRDVALKLIKVGMNSGQIVARFEAERQALAMMDHPSIARV
ncbi:MAG TPA: hypothetical protein PK402_13375, partial [Tepidisphaeraceae bacterium]|nr:hypothetical protein [Tepidisphaeraceae bacterium]